ncbi:MAG: hypothetical protein FWD52_05530 [Candidatus Bathyarchaeota archaeon]|nr:hypothetical protein [Candidatus Termiticorpusculum sp.]
MKLFKKIFIVSITVCTVFILLGAEMVQSVQAVTSINTLNGVGVRLYDLCSNPSPSIGNNDVFVYNISTVVDEGVPVCIVPSAPKLAVPELVIHTVVESEVELCDAIRASPDNSGYVYVIGVGQGGIVLEKSLEIPEGKNVGLVSADVSAYTVCLVGGDGVDTVIVKCGGELVLFNGVIITHAKGDRGRGVYVKSGGTFTMEGGEVSGNRATRGGGVYNEGIFNMRGDVLLESSKLFANTAAKGGGVYNVGTFILDGGNIYQNNCTNTLTSTGEGGGVYNAGTFSTVSTSVISYNTATKGGGVFNVGTFNLDFATFILYNTAAKGGGVYDAGTFNLIRGHLYSNTATSGEGNDVFNETITGKWSLYLLPIIVAFVAISILLVFLSLKKTNHQRQKFDCACYNGSKGSLNSQK